MWDGRTVAVLASGESMNAAVAQRVRDAGVPTIAINNTFALAPWADMLYAADDKWWDVHAKLEPCWKTFAGLKVSVSPTPFREVLTLTNTGVTGFDPDPANLRTGSNSGYQGVHIAAHAGARRILLCGFDMKGEHWHARHKPPLRNNEGGFFIASINAFKDVAPELSRRGIDVVNCTAGSDLQCFPFMSLDEALPTVCAPVV